MKPEVEQHRKELELEIRLSRLENQMQRIQEALRILNEQLLDLALTRKEGGQ